MEKTVYCYWLLINKLCFLVNYTRGVRCKQLTWHLTSSCIHGIGTGTFVPILTCWRRNMKNFENIRPLIQRAKYDCCCSVCLKRDRVFIRPQKCHDLKNRVKGLWRSLKFSPFDRDPMTSYWCSIVTMALSCVVSEIFNVETLESQSSRDNQGHWKWYHSIDWLLFPANDCHLDVVKPHITLTITPIPTLTLTVL